MNTDSIEKLIELGGKIWEKGNFQRIYFSPELAMDLDISYYNSGNISGATCQGYRISNSEAGRALGVKIWVDMNTGKVSTKYANRLQVTCRDALNEFTEKLERVTK